MTDYYPKQSPYGVSTAGTKYKDERYKRHEDWIEPLVALFTSRLSRGHNRICSDCGGKMNLTANIIRRHLASEKHLRAVDKWTEQDEAEMLDYKKTCMPKGNKPKNLSTDKNGD
jgi:hypothetical protein